MKQLRFAVVGTNYITDKLLEGAMQDERFKLVAVYSRIEETALSFAEKYGVLHIFTSLEAMAKCSEIDAVYIASPNALHAAQSILFLEHGKHVLCEKALASNAREVRAMVKVANERALVLMEAMKPTLTPNFSIIKEQLHRMGKVRHYFSSYCQYSSRYDAFKQGDILNAFRLELSNGALIDIGVYTIYPMVVLWGRPNTIHAIGTKLSTGVDGSGCIVFGYDGMEAVVKFSKIADSSLPTEIQGEDGTLLIDKIGTISHLTFISRNGNSESIEQIYTKSDFYYEVKEFIDIVESGNLESTINSHQNSLITMEIMDEARKQMGVVYPADR